MLGLKRYFQLDPTVTFLNHGSFGATPKPVFREYQRWQRELERQPVEFLCRRFTALMAESRAALGRYLGTQADNLVYVQNATIALNIVARSLELGPGDEVLSSDHEYGALDRTWRFLSKQRSFRYVNHPVSIPMQSQDQFVREFWSGVTQRTRVIFLSHITSPTALILPVQEIIQRAKGAGIITVIDGAHVPGQISLDLDSLGADFYAGNLHKWLCAPKGAGFLFARPERQSLLNPLVISWGYESETPGSSTYIDHHEWWGTRDVAAFLSVPAAIEFQEKHNWDSVRRECHKLAADSQRHLYELTGLAPLHSQTDSVRSDSGSAWFRQMFTASLPADVDVADLKNRLYEEYRIEVPVLEWNGNKLIRVSVQGYNARQDLNRLHEALSRLLH